MQKMKRRRRRRRRRRGRRRRRERIAAFDAVENAVNTSEEVVGVEEGMVGGVGGGVDSIEIDEVRDDVAGRELTSIEPVRRMGSIPIPQSPRLILLLHLRGDNR